ncbi:NADPH oxidase [Purpureocillium lavendulum]|uniref:NADPH oxidase n=1 Tax=Purpureocillium lavendulum TaxID=1247861 RepID=A0AB34FQ24_9HYPO|nr:NADPH oxidase [Purpureocillium lavendulum]
MAAAPTSTSQTLEDLVRAVETTHDHYIRSLRGLHDGLGIRGNGVVGHNAGANAQQAAPGRRDRDRADSRSSTLPLAMTPPLRAFTTFSNPPASYGSDTNIAAHAAGSGGGSGNASSIQFSLQSSLPRLRRSTLEATAERPVSLCPSPRPLLPLTPVPNHDPQQHHDFALIPDEDISFIPLLDATSGGASATRPLVPPAPSSVVTNEPDVILVPRGHPRHRLTPMSFSDDMLMRHLCDPCLVGGGGGDDDPVEVPLAQVLDEATRRRGEMSNPALSFRDFASFERESYVSTTLEVYDVTEDSSAVRVGVDADGGAGGGSSTMGARYGGDGVPYETADGIVDAPAVWEVIKDVNLDGDAVGRITIVQEPTPLILAALHLTMSPHFDMSELLSNLLSEAPNRGRTHAFMHRAFERAPSTLLLRPQSSLLDALPSPPPIPEPVASFAHLRQRSFFFVFKYYTSVGEGLEPAPWQRFDKRPVDKRLGDHIDIAECSSVLGLSLGGAPTKPLRMRPRRERVREGFLFDTFGPWHLLSIQSFPDDQHTVRGEDFQLKSFYNGPYAFLDLLISEYRDAGKRNLILHDRITKLITPPTEFMFDRRLRDKLLFEDKHFTYIRRYFWAYNTLAVINTGIKAMVAAYADTFTDDFWAGTHPLLWPHPAPASPEGLAYRDKMAVLRRELDKVVAELAEVLRRNERTRKEIENLRDQLFSGSSIKESRRAIDQGDNIQILTMISMVFLPLTFVTSVFGMTEFTIEATDWRFAVTMVFVCVPFMIVVFLFQTRSFRLVLNKLAAGGSWVVLFLRAAVGSRWQDAVPDAHHHQQQQQQQQQHPAHAHQQHQHQHQQAPRRGRKRRLVAAAAGGRATSRFGGLRPWWPWARPSGAPVVAADEVGLGKV